MQQILKIKSLSWITAIALLCGVNTWLFSQEMATRPDADIEIMDVSLQRVDDTRLGDTLTVKFNLLRKGGLGDENRILIISPGDSVEIGVKELIGKREEKIKPEYIPGSLRKLREKGSLRSEIPDDYYISLLVDRSKSYDEIEMQQIKTAIEEFARIVPRGHLFYSWFDEDISESKVVTPENLDELEFSITNKNTALYNAIYTKLIEFDSTRPTLNPPDYEPYYERNRSLERAKDYNKFLVVLTRGTNDIKQVPKYSDPELSPSFTGIMEPDLINEIERYRNKVFIYALNIGNQAVDREFLNMICVASGNLEGSTVVSGDSIYLGFSNLGTKIAKEKWDYEVLLRYDKTKSYRGEKRTLVMDMKRFYPVQFYARGEGAFGENYGSPMLKLTVGEPKPLGRVLLIGLLTGIIVFLLVLFTIQLIIPIIRNKIFVLKYVKKYKPKGSQLYKECQYCGDPLNPGEKVVMKCEHVVHHLCWKDYGHICPEYGQNCNEGKEDFFDISDPFSKKNKIYYLSWVIYGMIGGFLSWALYVIVIKNINWLFDFSDWLTAFIRPSITQTNIEAFSTKITPFLVVGIFLGFFLTVFYSLVEEYRHKNLLIISKIILRGILGGISGFISFLLGCIILILINHPEYLYFDWIPWIIFGVSVGVVMSINTTIVWKHGVIGGLISIIFCFIMIYLFAGEDLDQNIILTGFMIYGAGLGASIATIRSRSEHFFLKVVEGKKNQDIIPVHKWMSSSGGHNEVYIGRSFACEIQMNWEKNNEEIAQKHAKMYISSRSKPVVVSLALDKITHFNNRFDMNTGKEYELHNGVRFKIGNTMFEYIETE